MLSWFNTLCLIWSRHYSWIHIIHIVFSAILVFCLIPLRFSIVLLPFLAPLYLYPSCSFFCPAQANCYIVLTLKPSCVGSTTDRHWAWSGRSRRELNKHRPSDLVSVTDLSRLHTQHSCLRLSPPCNYQLLTRAQARAWGEQTAAKGEGGRTALRGSSRVAHTVCDKS